MKNNIMLGSFFIGLCLMIGSCQKEEISLEQQFSKGGILAFWEPPQTTRALPTFGWSLVASKMRGGQADVLTKEHFGTFSGTWSDNGRTLFIENQVLYAIGLDKKEEAIQTQINLNSFVRNLQWTPDERYLALTIENNRKLIIYDLVEQSYVFQTDNQQSSNRLTYYSLKWSPDGSKLAFVVQTFNTLNNSIDEQLMIYDLQTGFLEEVEQPVSGFSPSDFQWGPNAENIYLPVLISIFRYNIANKQLEEYMSFPGKKLSSPVISPDGRLLAISSRDIGLNISSFYIIDLQSQEMRLIDDGPCSRFIWSLDGSSIMYYNLDERQVKIDRLDDDQEATAVYQFEPLGVPNKFFWLQK